MAYSMGQHLYSANYLPNPDRTSAYLVKNSIEVKGIRLGGTNYRDLKITPSGISFEPNSSYLLRLRIRRNIAYDLEVDLKLMNESNSGGDTSTAVLNEQKYEEIQRIYIPRAENFQRTSSVVLYKSQEDETESSKKVYAGVLRETSDNCGWYDVYDKNPESTPSYYYKDPTKNEMSDPFTEIEQRSIVNLPHTWEQGEEDTFSSFDIVFSPKANNGNFNRIVLQMTRPAYNNDITFYDAKDNHTYNGVHINEDSISSGGEEYFAELYEVTNLLGNIIIPKTITHLGIWSHPNLIIAINGEEIRVGPSGYYELNDYDITSLGIVCLTQNDKFTIDYQYEL